MSGKRKLGECSKFTKAKSELFDDSGDESKYIDQNNDKAKRSTKKRVKKETDEDNPPIKKTKVARTKIKDELGELNIKSEAVEYIKIEDTDSDEPSDKLKLRKKAATKLKHEFNIKPENDVETICSEIDEPPTKKKRATKKTTKTIKEEISEHPTSSKLNNNLQTGWYDYQLLSEFHHLDTKCSKNIVRMFEEGSTIPFIARYRKDITNNMSPETLRDIKNSYDKILTLKAKSQSVLKSLQAAGHLTPSLQQSILNATTLEEVEHMYAPYKPSGKKTLVERAKKLGLEDPAMKILNTHAFVDLNRLVAHGNDELDTYEKVEKGIVHIIAHIISTDAKVLTFVRDLRSKVTFGLEVKKAIKRTKKTDASKDGDEGKYENYFDFKIATKYIKPHQVLAINRGEHQNILSVKVTMPDFVVKNFSQHCWKIWSPYIKSDNVKTHIFNEAVQDSFKRLIQPLIVREIRSDLKAQAEKASYDVFCNNLKQLLLTAPVKGRPILGIDPGYANGCKVAVISSNGSLLDSTVIYPHNKNVKYQVVLRNLIQEHRCSLIALGNGTACRETESWLSNLISEDYFKPVDVQYTIVNENGASIYSCGVEAKKEFPDLDPNIISAVSLARRVQEPLGEYVKVEPKHLGVGMYQHDLPKKQLECALDCVVSECVSFVGVDINTSSQCLLKRVAGLSDKRAALLIAYREKNGPFINRKQLTEIKGIGAKTYEQCAGFLKVGPITAEEEKDFYKNAKTNKLDCTIIHPESYELTLRLLKKLNLKLVDIGNDNFINTVKNLVDYEELSKELNSTEFTIKLILDALSKPLNYDLRNDCSKIPLFKKGLTSISDLKRGTILTGSVNNNTHFGAFIDIGVGSNGLIHVSKMRGQNLQIGNVVEVSVVDVDIYKKRIGLELIRVM